MIKAKKEIAKILKMSISTLSLYLASDNVFEKYRRKGSRSEYRFNNEFLIDLLKFCERRRKTVYDNRRCKYEQFINNILDVINYDDSVIR